MDYYLIYLTVLGEQSAYELLEKKYRFFIFSMAKQFLQEGHCFFNDYYENLIGEGYIVFVNSIYSYDGNNKASFYTYFILLLTKSFFRQIRAVYNDKRIAKRYEISFSGLNKEFVNHESNYLIDHKLWSNPELVLYAKEDLSRVNTYFNQMTKLEAEVLRYFAVGYTAKEIAKKMNVSYRTVENAIRRAREKVNRLNYKDLAINEKKEKKY